MGGGIGDTTPRLSFKYDDKGKFILKIILDILFHIIVSLILQNIFFGIIVDTFNELRDEKDLKDKDEKNKCLLCNMDRYNNSKGEDFDIHRKNKHKIFNYIYFIPYLLKKNTQEYSRAETYAWMQINMKKFDWYPGIIKEEDS